jgi:D-aminoacyl-tRNA deacylase
MRALLQRVQHAQVVVDDDIVGQIKIGWLVFLGVGIGDSSEDVDYIVDRIIKLRAFADDNGKMNRSIIDVDGQLLVISQFTLFADLKSRRPGFTQAAEPALGNELYEEACRKFQSQNVPVEKGIFAADMKVMLLNDGPVTFWLDSRQR